MGQSLGCFPLASFFTALHAIPPCAGEGMGTDPLSWLCSIHWGMPEEAEIPKRPTTSAFMGDYIMEDRRRLMQRSDVK